MLINKAGNIVDLVVNDHVEILLGGVCLDIGESELLRHFEGSFVYEVIKMICIVEIDLLSRKIV